MCSPSPPGRRAGRRRRGAARARGGRPRPHPRRRHRPVADRPDRRVLAALARVPDGPQPAQHPRRELDRRRRLGRDDDRADRRAVRPRRGQHRRLLLERPRAEPVVLGRPGRARDPPRPRRRDRPGPVNGALVVDMGINSIIATLGTLAAIRGLRARAHPRTAGRGDERVPHPDRCRPAARDPGLGLRDGGPLRRRLRAADTDQARHPHLRGRRQPPLRRARRHPHQRDHEARVHPHRPHAPRSPRSSSPPSRSRGRPCTGRTSSWTS